MEPTINVTTRIPTALYLRIKKYCFNNGHKMQTFITRILARAMEGK